MPTTESHNEVCSVQFEEGEAESDTRRSEDSVLAESPENADSHAETAESPLNSAISESDEPTNYLAALRSWITPPEIWTEPAEPLKSEWEYATSGEWTDNVGVLRKLGQVYSIAVVFPIFAVADYVKWIVKRPSRLLFTVVLLVVLAQLPPLSWIV